jgi:hypothetical protein
VHGFRTESVRFPFKLKEIDIDIQCLFLFPPLASVMEKTISEFLHEPRCGLHSTIDRFAIIDRKLTVSPALVKGYSEQQRYGYGPFPLKALRLLFPCAPKRGAASWPIISVYAVFLCRRTGAS